MTDSEFKKERQAALEEMDVVLTKRFETLAKTLPKTYDAATAGIPEHARTEKTVGMNMLALLVVKDLLANEPLVKTFGRASARLHPADTRPAAASNGRDSAIIDVLKALDIAERDFDANYKPLDRDMVKHWQKKHPMPADAVQLAYKENQRHFMKESLQEIRALLTPSAPKPSGPKP